LLKNSFAPFLLQFATILPHLFPKGLHPKMIRRVFTLFLSLPVLGGEISQKVEFGYFGTTGNSSVNSLTGAYKLIKKFSKSEVSFFTDVLYATRNGNKSKERYRSSFKLNHFYNSNFYQSFEFSFLRDPFKGYNQQYNIIPGIGYKLSNSKSNKLHLILGYEFRRNNYTYGTAQNFNYFKGSVIDRLKLPQETSLKTKLDFIQNIEDSTDFEMEVENSLKFHLVNNLSFKISFEYRFDNLPPRNRKKFDTLTKATIVYRF